MSISDISKVLEGLIKHAVPFGALIHDSIVKVVRSYEEELRKNPPFFEQEEHTDVDDRMKEKLDAKFD